MRSVGSILSKTGIRSQEAEPIVIGGDCYCVRPVAAKLKTVGQRGFVNIEDDGLISFSGSIREDGDVEHNLAIGVGSRDRNAFCGKREIRVLSRAAIRTING